MVSVHFERSGNQLVMQKAALNGIIDDGSGVRSRIEGIAGITWSKGIIQKVERQIEGANDLVDG